MRQVERLSFGEIGIGIDQTDLICQSFLCQGISKGRANCTRSHNNNFSRFPESIHIFSFLNKINMDIIYPYCDIFYNYYLILILDKMRLFLVEHYTISCLIVWLSACTR